MSGTAAQIKIIHVAIRRLGLTEDEYRALYEGQTGKRSLKEMTVRETGRVLEAMMGYGFKKDGRAQAPAHTRADGRAQSTARTRDKGITLCADPQPRKIRALWLRLRDMGVLRNPSELALLTYVKRLTRVDRMEWLDSGQLSHVIETLKSWVNREAAARGLPGE
jgi:phage gp16-like protein